MSPLTTNPVPLHYIFLEYMVPKMYKVMINFRIMIGVPLMLIIGMLILKKSLIGLIEVPLGTDHKDISEQESRYH